MKKPRGCLACGTVILVFFSQTTNANGVKVGPGLIDRNVTSLAASGGDLFAGTADGCFYSANKGADWTAVNSGLSEHLRHFSSFLRKNSYI
jgi:hypothetical protein